jgi:hypothetical protein
MIDTEDSVVTSLNELRKLKNERRQSRQRSTGQRAQAVRAVETASEELTPRPVQTQDVVSQPVPAFAAFAPAPAVVFPDNRGMAIAPTIIQKKSSAKPAIIVALLLTGAGGFGYINLQNQTQAVLAAKSVEVRDAEEARNKAIESLARTEQLAKTNLRQCEDKLKLATAAAPARSVAPAIAPAEPSPSHSSRPTIARSSRPARRVAAAAPAEPATPKTSAVPTIAKRKVILDDPLAGLGKP